MLDLGLQQCSERVKEAVIVRLSVVLAVAITKLIVHIPIGVALLGVLLGTVRSARWVHHKTHVGLRPVIGIVVILVSAKKQLRQIFYNPLVNHKQYHLLRCHFGHT